MDLARISYKTYLHQARATMFTISFFPNPTVNIYLSAKKAFNFSSSHFKSSLLSPGPPAQWPQIEGKTSICPTPGFIFATSISESSGLKL